MAAIPRILRRRGQTVYTSVSALLRVFPGETATPVVGDPTVTAWCATAVADEALDRFQMSRADRLDELVAVLGRVPATITRGLESARRLDRWPSARFSESAARLTGQAAATGAHIGLALAVERAAGRRPRAAARDRVVERVAAERSRYRGALHVARRTARAGDVERLGQLLDETVRHVHGDLATLCGDAAAAAHPDHPRHASLGLQASALGRRYVMLVAALLLLQWRLHNRYTASATRRIASSRLRLRRDVPRLGSARRDLAGLAFGTRVRVFGRARSVVFEERPRRPFSTVTLESVDCTLIALLATSPVDPHNTGSTSGLTASAD